MMIQTSTPENETPVGSFGTFDSYDVTADWTDEDWHQHDAEIAADMAAYDEAMADEYVDFDPEPPF